MQVGPVFPEEQQREQAHADDDAEIAPKQCPNLRRLDANQLFVGQLPRTSWRNDRVERFVRSAAADAEIVERGQRRATVMAQRAVVSSQLGSRRLRFKRRKFLRHSGSTQRTSEGSL